MRQAFVRLLAPATVGLALSLAGAARADIVVLAGVNNQGTEDILLDGGALDPNVAGTGQTTGGGLAFVADEDVTATTSGQIAIVANDGALTTLSVLPTAPSNLLTRFVVNVNAVTDGTVALSIYEPTNEVNTFNFSVAGSGENFFTITAVNGQKMSRIDIGGAFGTQISAFSLMRGTFEGLPPDLESPIPEPATWAAMVCGFAGIGALARRKRTRIA
jgi:hypothetical protein